MPHPALPQPRANYAQRTRLPLPLLLGFDRPQNHTPELLQLVPDADADADAVDDVRDVRGDALSIIPAMTMVNKY